MGRPHIRHLGTGTIMSARCSRGAGLPRALGRAGVAANLTPRAPASSEAAFPPPQAAAASLALERLPGCGSVPAARAVRIERSQSRLTWLSFFGRVDDELPSIELVVVKEPDCRACLGLGRELDECEPPGPSGFAIGWQVDLDDVARLGQERGQRVRSRPKRQIANENTGWDGSSSFRVDRCVRPWRRSISAPPLRPSPRPRGKVAPCAPGPTDRPMRGRETPVGTSGPTTQPTNGLNDAVRPRCCRAPWRG